MNRADRQILHVDMDAFYASVEQRDDPSLRGKPVIVGGASRRGVVCAASYEARPFGVRSAMSMVEARARCKEAIVVPPRMARYTEVSRDVFTIFRRYTPLVEGLSLDEAFLDVSASRSLFGDGTKIARAIKDAIHDELKLIASAGVSSCKFVSKVASDLKKPNALVVVPHGDERAFLDPLPIERMWGIGPKTAPKMRSMGFLTLGDLARSTDAKLERALGTWGLLVHALAQGEDDRDVNPAGLAKSVGAEMTYEEDLRTRDAIAKTLLDHASRVAQRMMREGLWGRTVTTKLKYADFHVLTRRVTLADAISDAQTIYEAAESMLDRFPLEGARVRLTGVSVSELSEEAPMRSLFPDVERDRRRKVEELMTQVSARFGDDRIRRATLLELDDDDESRVHPR